MMGRQNNPVRSGDICSEDNGVKSEKGSNAVDLGKRSRGRNYGSD